jgi:hypothetical protein
LKGDPRITGYYNDRDARTRDCIAEKLENTEFLDQNHVVKGLNRELAKVTVLNKLKADRQRFSSPDVSWYNGGEG